MTKKRLWLTVAISALIAPAMVHAQGEPEYGIKFGGFVKFDAFNDSRQVVAARDDMFYWYPAARSQITSVPGTGAVPCVLATFGAAACNTNTGLAANTFIDDLDAQALYVFGNKTDLNARGQTGMTAVQSRLSGKITAPDAFGAKVTGLLEGDFFGQANKNYAFGLRHAWVNLDWGKTSLRAGQDWHPLFLQGGIFPGTLQFNPIAPIHPFGRNPQVAFTMKPVEGFRLSFYAMEQSGHADGDGQPMRNARVPELAVQADFKVGGLTVGGTYDRKVLAPYDQTDPSAVDGQPPSKVGNNTNTITYSTYQAYAQLKQGDLTLKASTTWGDNWASHLGFGSYGVKQSVIGRNLSTLLASQGVPADDIALLGAMSKDEYSPTKSQGYWAEIAYGKDVEFAIVGGKVTNNGAADQVSIASLSTNGRNGHNLKQVITIAPRVKMTSGKTVFGIEYIYSEAAYLEDDKNFQAAINYAKIGAYSTDAGLGSALNTTGQGGYSVLRTTEGLSFNNGAIVNDNGRIGSTYKVSNHRIQLSVQQNF